jgi:hypothetical protein
MRLASALLVLTAGVTGTAGATSFVPDPMWSTVPACVTLEPSGRLAFVVVVRDIAGNPLASSSVLLELCGCQGLVLCPPASGPPDCTPIVVSGLDGRARFELAGGGGCAHKIAVYADGVRIDEPADSRHVASPDQNGNLTVNGVDREILVAKTGGSDPTGDLDGDGDVDGADVAIVDAMMGGTCDGVVPTRNGSWGDLKILYR